MKKLIIFAVIVVILFIGVVFNGSNKKDNVEKRQQAVHNLIDKDGGQGISIAKAAKHNDMFHGFLEDTLNFEHHKATIAGLKHQWETSVKPNQVLPKPTYDKEPVNNTQQVSQPKQLTSNNGSGSSVETVTYAN